MKQITEQVLNNLREAYMADEKARVVRNALNKNDIASISRVQEAVIENPNIFSIDLKTMPATNQKQSGRCWIFSSMNVLREMIARKYQIREFELSQNYIAFYDKLEKANWFMECVMEEIEKPLDSENMRFLLDNAVGDGGQWNMVQSLVKKYGICPKEAMPETFQSSHTRSMNAILNRRLRKFTADAHRAVSEGRRSDVTVLKEQALKEIYGLIASCFGMPPVEFTFAYRDKQDQYHAVYHVTPMQMYEEYVSEDIDDYINIIHSPTEDKAYYQNYTVKYLGNVVGGNQIRLLNLPMNVFKQAVIDQLKAGEPVWFGCDCSSDGDRESGLWDDGQNDYEHTFDMSLSMSKEDMLNVRQSAMNHAMVFTGVNLDENGKPNRWKIENSWGDKIADKGYFVCSDSWFDAYMYVIAVNKKYLDQKVLDAGMSQPVEVAPWDPFGTLAD